MTSDLSPIIASILSGSITCCTADPITGSCPAPDIEQAQKYEKMGARRALVLNLRAENERLVLSDLNETSDSLWP